MPPCSLLLSYDAFALTGGQHQGAGIREKMPLRQKRPQLSGGHQGVAQQKGPPANIFTTLFSHKESEWVSSFERNPTLISLLCRTALVWSYGREGGSSSPTTVCFTIKVHSLWRRTLFVTLSSACTTAHLCFSSPLLHPTTDSREESVLGSIPLPSYKILFCTPRECKNRKFTFKVLALCYSLKLGDIRREAQQIHWKTINFTNIFSVSPKF